MRRERKNTYMEMAKDAMDRTFWAKGVNQQAPHSLPHSRRQPNPKAHRPGTVGIRIRQPPPPLWQILTATEWDLPAGAPIG